MDKEKRRSKPEKLGKSETRRHDDDRLDWGFGQLLAWHMELHGTRPDGDPLTPRKPWTPKTLGRAITGGQESEQPERTVGYWLKDQHFPKTTVTLERVLFGDNVAYDNWRVELRRALVRSRARMLPKRRPPKGEAASPYPGLRPFRIDEDGIFFGREREITAILNRVRDPGGRFIAVVGASGAGKSSLVYAGVLPRLQAVTRAEGYQWPVLAFTPGFVNHDPFTSLAVELDRLLPQGSRRRPAELAAKLASQPDAFSELVAPLLDGHRESGASLILFVDQLEELVSLSDAPSTGRFVELLQHCATRPEIRVIATLRADFLPKFVARADFELMLQSQGAMFPMGPPGLGNLLDIIRRPAEQAGVELDPDVGDQILRDAGLEVGAALPLVAFCLRELYEHIGDRRLITLADYRKIGGLKGAIGRRAKQIFHTLSPDGGPIAEQNVEKLFEALVNVELDGQVTRKWTSLENLLDGDGALADLVPALIEERLLTADVQDQRGEALISLTHEALIREWPDLAIWLETHKPWLQEAKRFALDMSSTQPADRRRALARLGQFHPRRPILVDKALQGLRDPEQVVRSAAMAALSDLADTMPGAVEGLYVALNDPDLCSEAAFMLVKAEPPNLLDRLLRLLAHGTSGGRCGAAHAFGCYAHLNALTTSEIRPDVVRALTKALADREPNVSKAAARSLQRMDWLAKKTSSPLRTVQRRFGIPASETVGEVGPEAIGAVPSLITMLALQDDDSLRCDVCQTLGRIGPAARDAIPTLRRLLAHLDPRLRAAAALALGHIGVRSEPAVPDLIALVSYDSYEVSTAAIWALGEIGSAARPAIPELTKAARSSDNSNVWALEALGKISTLDDDARGVLRFAARWAGGENDIRSHAIEALGHIDPVDDESVRLLISLLSDYDQDIHDALLGAFLNIAQRAPSVLDELGRIALDNSDDDRAWLAGLAIANAGQLALPHLPTLIAAMGTTWGHQAAFEGLERLGGAYPGELVPALTSALTDASETIREGAALLLGQLGPHAFGAVPSLLEALDDENIAPRWGAACALASFAQPETSGALVRLLTDEDDQVREAAVRGLGNIGPACLAEALPEVLRLFDDTSIDVCRSAMNAATRLAPEDNDVRANLRRLVDARGASSDLAQKALDGIDVGEAAAAGI